VVVVEVSAGGAARRLEPHTGDGRPVVYGRFTIALLELAPYPFSARPIDPADYRARLRVTG
jgi:hypothetical protein